LLSSGALRLSGHLFNRLKSKKLDLTNCICLHSFSLYRRRLTFLLNHIRKLSKVKCVLFILHIFILITLIRHHNNFRECYTYWILQTILNTLVILLYIKRNNKHKIRAFAVLRIADNLTLITLNNFLGDKESETDAFGVQLF